MAAPTRPGFTPGYCSARLQLGSGGAGVNVPMSGLPGTAGGSSGLGNTGTAPMAPISASDIGGVRSGCNAGGASGVTPGTVMP